MPDGRISKQERENYLIKLEKEFAFAGASIPERITVDDRQIDLRTYVFEITRKKGALSPEEQQDVDQVAALARKKRREIIAEIATADMNRHDADERYRMAAGLGRALDTLGRAHEPRSSLSEVARQAKIEDGRRWLNLVKKIYQKEKKDREGFQ